MSYDDHNPHGWQALLEFQGNPCQDLQQALHAASALGWTLDEEEAIDASLGLWLCVLTKDDVAELVHTGTGSIDRYAYGAHGHVELP